MAKLLHQHLLDLGIVLGYQSLDKGICHGFSMMYAQAILANDEATFLERLKFIESYNPNYKKLKKNIEVARQKIRANPFAINDAKIRQLIEIPAFYESLVLYHKPLQHDAVFSQPTALTQSEQTSIYPFARPDALADDDLFVVFKKVQSFNIPSALERFLQSLEKSLSSIAIQTPILITSTSHAIAVCYNPQQKYWKYLDTNHLSKTYLIDELTAAELAEHIFNSYSLLNVTIAMTLFSLNKHKHLYESTGKLIAKVPLNTFLTNEDAFLLAASQGSIDVLEQILDKDKSAFCRITNFSQAIDLACQNKQYEIVCRLLEQAQIDVNVKNSAGIPPLIWAIMTRESRIVHALLQRRELDINFIYNKEVTPLLLAIAVSSDEIVEQLLNREEIDINFDLDNLNALTLVFLKNNWNLFRKLILHPKLDIKYHNKAFLMMCATADYDLLIAVYNKGLFNRAEISFKALGLIALSQSSNAAINPEFFTFLLNEGVSILQKCSEGKTALDYAVQRNNTVAIRELLRHAKRLNIPLKEIANANTLCTLSILEHCSGKKDSQAHLKTIMEDLYAHFPTLSGALGAVDQNAALQSLIPTQYEALKSVSSLLTALTKMGRNEQKLAISLECSIRTFYTNNNPKDRAQVKQDIVSAINNYKIFSTLYSGLIILGNTILALSIIGMPIKAFFSQNHSMFFSMPTPCVDKKQQAALNDITAKFPDDSCFGCGRNRSYLLPPAQIRTCATNASGSYLGCLA